MLRGSSQYTLRYHLTAMYREVIILTLTDFTSLTLECFPKTLYNVVQMLLNQYTGAKIVVFSAPAKQSMKNTAEEALRLEAQSLH